MDILQVNGTRGLLRWFKCSAVPSGRHLPSIYSPGLCCSRHSLRRSPACSRDDRCLRFFDHLHQNRPCDQLSQRTPCGTLFLGIRRRAAAFSLSAAMQNQNIRPIGRVPDTEPRWLAMRNTVLKSMREPRKRCPKLPTLSLRRNPRVFMRLRTLCSYQISQPLCNQAVPHSLVKTPGVGVCLLSTFTISRIQTLVWHV